MMTIELHTDAFEAADVPTPATLAGVDTFTVRFGYYEHLNGPYGTGRFYVDDCEAFEDDGCTRPVALTDGQHEAIRVAVEDEVQYLRRG